jgi:ribosomal protein S18 acetylase RimI-like enzyme
MAVSAGHQGRGIGSALMREMIDLCDNWLRVDRIELTVFADNEPAIAVYKNTDLRSKAPASARCATVSMWMRIIWRE